MARVAPLRLYMIRSPNVMLSEVEFPLAETQGVETSLSLA
jgi:hypothetical protein